MLIVADQDPGTRIANFLHQSGWSCEVIELGAGALVIAAQRRPRVVLVHAPQVEHAHILFCQSLRQMDELESVLLVGLTGSHDLGGRLRLLEFGADECWSGAFETEEFSLRLKQLHRGRSPANLNQVLQHGGIGMDLDGHKASLDGAPLRLTPTQMKVLRYFLEHPATVITSKELKREVWGNARLQEATVDACISTMRRVLSRAGGQPVIQRTGDGYALY